MTTIISPIKFNNGWIAYCGQHRRVDGILWSAPKGGWHTVVSAEGWMAYCGQRRGVDGILWSAPRGFLLMLNPRYARCELGNGKADDDRSVDKSQNDLISQQWKVHSTCRLAKYSYQ